MFQISVKKSCFLLKTNCFLTIWFICLFSNQIFSFYAFFFEFYTWIIWYIIFYFWITGSFVFLKKLRRCLYMKTFKSLVEYSYVTVQLRFCISLYSWTFRPHIVNSFIISVQTIFFLCPHNLGILEHAPLIYLGKVEVFPTCLTNYFVIRFYKRRVEFIWRL